MSRLQAFFTPPGMAASQSAPQPLVQPTPGQQIQQPQVPRPSQPKQGTSLMSVQPGMLIRFNYRLAKNDPKPVVIVSRIDGGKSLLKGVNLHYLTFPYCRRILYSVGINRTLSYYNIKSDRYITDAFRSYSWAGIDQSSLEVFDVAFITKMMNLSASMDPMQVRSMRQSIDNQINMRVNQEQALPTGPMPMGQTQMPQAYPQAYPQPNAVNPAGNT